MSETIASTQAMPDILMSLIYTNTVKIREEGGVVTVIPIHETGDSCALYGLLGEGKLSVEKFLQQKRADKELEA
ncbi:MAG: hypothetical protein LBS74_07890 [Oscillospiraceae bacterium]|jgi:hypothetical protein|nr:hypothetical protein [Oscillospiraceae bacterium]